MSRAKESGDAADRDAWNDAAADHVLIVESIGVPTRDDRAGPPEDEQ